MKFLVPNYSCLQNPCLGGYRPPDPHSLCPLSSTEFVEPLPRIKFLGTPLHGGILGWGYSLWGTNGSFLSKTGICFNCFNTWCIAGLFLPHVQYLFWCVEKCVVQFHHIDIHVHITFCIHCPTWKSNVITDCEFLLNSSPFTDFHRKSKILTHRSWSLNVVAMMMEAARTAAMLVLLFQTI